MTDPLTTDRFRVLAEAYGGVVARWPAETRDAAARIAAMPEGAAILREASALDRRLDAWRVPPPPADLPARVMAGRPAAVAGLAARMRWWWSGLGIAAALAGAAAGTAAVALVAPPEMGADGTSFGDVAGSDR